MQGSVTLLEDSLKIVIDQTGAVEAALMKVPSSLLYDSAGGRDRAEVAVLARGDRRCARDVSQGCSDRFKR